MWQRGGEGWGCGGWTHPAISGSHQPDEARKSYRQVRIWARDDLQKKWRQASGELRNLQNKNHTLFDIGVLLQVRSIRALRSVGRGNSCGGTNIFLGMISLR